METPQSVVEELIRTLANGSEYDRYHAADRLRDVPKTRPVLLALVQALADPGFYETPGDYDAPPFHYPVAAAAAEALMTPEAESVRDEVLALARKSDTAAFYAPRVLAWSGHPSLLGELLRHESNEVRERAIYAIRPMMDRLGVEPLMPLLLEALLDDAVAFAAVGALRHVLGEHPELKLEARELLGPLVERMRLRPGACTFFEAAEFFRKDPAVYRTWVELAAEGSHCAARQLRRHPEGLTSEDVGRLVGARPSTELLELLAVLKDPRAIPHLVPLLEDPRLRELALSALLQTPGGAAHVTEWNRWFLEHRDLRALVARFHPDPSALLPFVRERLGGLSERQRDGLEMMKALGPVAAPLARKACQLTRLGVTPPYLRTLALSALVACAPESPETETALARLLEWTETTDYALKHVLELGPRAARMREILEVMRLEKRYQRSHELLDRALAGLEKKETRPS